MFFCHAIGTRRMATADPIIGKSGCATLTVTRWCWPVQMVPPTVIGSPETLARNYSIIRTMIHRLLVRQRILLGQPVREPTLLALALTALGILLLLAACYVAAYLVASFGLGWFAFVAVAVLLAALLVIPHLRRHVDTPSSTGRTRWLRRIRGAGRALLAVMLAAWLGLIAWSELTPGGPMPPRPEPGAVRVLTWNILHGSDDGLPWQQQNWRARKHALAAVLREVQPDLLGVQEARPEQVAFLE